MSVNKIINSLGLDHIWGLCVDGSLMLRDDSRIVILEGNQIVSVDTKVYKRPKNDWFQVSFSYQKPTRYSKDQHTLQFNTKEAAENAIQDLLDFMVNRPKYVMDHKERGHVEAMRIGAANDGE